MSFARFLLLALATFGLAPWSAAQEVTLRLHHFLAETSSIHYGYLVPWAERVEAQSEGRIDVQIFPSMQLGGAAPSLVDQLVDGVVDLVWTLPGYTTGRFPASEVFELPFMTGPSARTSPAVCAFYREHLADEYAAMHPITLYVSSRGLFHVQGDPIRTIDDLDGRLVRGPSRLTTEALALLGAEPVGMPVPQVPESLSRGVIDGALLPWEVTAPLRIAELVDAHTDFATERGLYASVFLFAMNRERYASLPDDLRAVIDANSMHDGCDEAAIAGRAVDEADRLGIELAEAAENPIHVVSEAATEAWIAALAPLRRTWVADMNALGYDGQALLDRAVQLVDEALAR